ncbi:hypothetical protein ABZ863_34990 [Saccharomonospora sp. NPDC046836]|uniref:hypothetical protein n=1 Tax=Saccharomonospora sp. NPDC046836 TaxID=3156921 RepID=UPI0033CF72D7
MNRPLFLRASYFLGGAWVTYCAVVSAQAGAPATAATFVVVLGLLLIAAIREAELAYARAVAADLRRALRVHTTRAARRTDHAALDGACCLPGWESRGATHSDTCAERAA